MRGIVNVIALAEVLDADGDVGHVLGSGEWSVVSGVADSSCGSIRNTQTTVRYFSDHLLHRGLQECCSRLHSQFGGFWCGSLQDIGKPFPHCLEPYKTGPGNHHASCQSHPPMSGTLSRLVKAITRLRLRQRLTAISRGDVRKYCIRKIALSLRTASPVHLS
jgi:hypothetical protein